MSNGVRNFEANNGPTVYSFGRRSWLRPRRTSSTSGRRNGACSRSSQPVWPPPCIFSSPCQAGFESQSVLTRTCLQTVVAPNACDEYAELTVAEHRTSARSDTRQPRRRLVAGHRRLRGVPLQDTALGGVQHRRVSVCCRQGPAYCMVVAHTSPSRRPGRRSRWLSLSMRR